MLILIRLFPLLDEKQIKLMNEIKSTIKLFDFGSMQSKYYAKVICLEDNFTLQYPYR